MKKGILTFGLLLGVIFAPAQSLDEILDGYFDAIGGVEIWKTMESLKMSGTSNTQGMEFPLTIYSKRPNLEKIEVEIQGMLLIPQAFDGEVAWTVNPFMGSEEATKLDEGTTKTLASKEFENEFINYQDKGHKVEFMGKDSLNDRGIHKIRLTKLSGEETLYYFDTETSLPVMVRSIAEAGPMKGQSVETYLSDYREVEGVSLPFELVTKVGGSTVWSARLDEIDINADISEEIFKFPGVGEEETMPDSIKNSEQMKEEGGQDSGEMKVKDKDKKGEKEKNKRKKEDKKEG